MAKIKLNKKTPNNSIKDDYLNYIKSPLALSRLKKSGVEYPEDTQNKKIEALKKTSVFKSNLSQSHTQGSDTPIIILDKKANKYVLSHEKSHATSGGDSYIESSRPNLPQGTQMTANEDKMFWSKNKTLQGMFPKTVINTKTKKAEIIKVKGTDIINDSYQMDKQRGSYTSDIPNDVFKGSDTHEVSTRENKADLDAVRQLLFDKKITKSFGEDLSSDHLKKALSNPEIINESHFKRLRKSFSDDDIIKLNNTVASVNSSNNKTNV